MPTHTIKLEDAERFFGKLGQNQELAAKQGLYSAALRMVNIIKTQTIPAANPPPVDRGL